MTAGVVSCVTAGVVSCVTAGGVQGDSYVGAGCCRMADVTGRRKDVGIGMFFRM